MLEDFLNRWAAEQGFQIVQAEPGPWKKVEVLFSAPRTEQAFRITIRTKDGERRAGSARVVETGWWKPEIQVDVRWDDQAISSQ